MTHEDEIAEYLALKGVTRCPTVCLNKTTASTSKQDRKILKKHQEKQNELADASFKRTFYRRVIFFLLGFNFLPLFDWLS